MYELIPHIWDVVIDGVESIDLDSHITYPSFNIRSLDEGKSDSNFLDWGVKSYNVLVDSEVSFDFFDESICFMPRSIKYPW
jgi:hypothetical protein